MGPRTFKATRTWLAGLVVSSMTMASLGCDSNPGGPTAPSPSSSDSAASDAPKSLTTAEAATKGKGSRVKQRLTKPKTAPVPKAGVL